MVYYKNLFLSIVESWTLILEYYNIMPIAYLNLGMLLVHLSAPHVGGELVREQLRLSHQLRVDHKLRKKL